MPHVLIVEDEALLRKNLARGIAKMEGVTVADAGSVDEALLSIASARPDLVLSDIDMPERSGIELLGELGKRGFNVPVIFVSAYLKAYRAQIPQHANIDIVEKPVALADLRALIADKLAQAEDASPFAVPDYLQLAGMGRRSVRIEVAWADGTEGEVVVSRGAAWHARVGDMEGIDAFAVVAWRPDAKIRVRTLEGEPGHRSLSGSVEALLMDTARVLDEYNRDLAGGKTNHSPDYGDIGALLPSEIPFEEDEDAPPSSRRRADNQRHVDDGVRALLAKDYPAAVRAFRLAVAIDPMDPIAKTNLERLRQMGHDQPTGDKHD